MLREGCDFWQGESDPARDDRTDIVVFVGRKGRVVVGRGRVVVMRIARSSTDPWSEWWMTIQGGR